MIKSYSCYFFVFCIVLRFFNTLYNITGCHKLGHLLCVNKCKTISRNFYFELLNKNIIKCAYKSEDIHFTKVMEKYSKQSDK